MDLLVVCLFLCFFAAQLLIEISLNLINLRYGRRFQDQVPLALEGQVDKEIVVRSLSYTQARGRLDIVNTLYDATIVLALLFSGILPAIEGTLISNRVDGAYLFVIFLVAFSLITALLHLPFSLYGTFVLEQRYGFNRTTFALWIKDLFKSLLISTLIGIPLLYSAYGFFSFFGSGWWFWLFLFLLVIQIGMVWLFPIVIAPLFNKFEPLPAGPLRERLEKLAKESKFNTRGLYVMDASRRSGHSNAYFSGFFRPRIVLFDTLIQKMNIDETSAVLAHEIGHYRARHVYKRLVFSVVVQLLTLWLLSKLVAWPPLFSAFGFSHPSFYAALALVSLCGGAFTFFFAPISSLVSRRHEYQADKFAIQVTDQPEAMKSALIKLNQENLSNLYPHPWYSAWNYSHPTLLERLSAIDEVSTP